jgi:hypothetical protein
LPSGRIAALDATLDFHHGLLADLLRGVVDRIQLPEHVADSISQRLRTSQSDLAQARERSSARRRSSQRVEGLGNENWRIGGYVGGDIAATMSLA